MRRPSPTGMKCDHNQYRSVVTSYDRGRGILVYFWRCDRCGAHLGEHQRASYRPLYESALQEQALLD